MIKLLKKKFGKAKPFHTVGSTYHQFKLFHTHLLPRISIRLVLLTNSGKRKFLLFPILDSINFNSYLEKEGLSVSWLPCLSPYCDRLVPHSCVRALSLCAGALFGPSSLSLDLKKKRKKKGNYLIIFSILLVSRKADIWIFGPCL